MKLLIMALIVTLFVLIQVLYVKRTESVVDEIEFNEEKKSRIYKNIYTLYGIYTCLELVALVVIMLLS